MKKILALTLALCMVLALCACGSEAATTPVEETAAPVVEETAEPVVEEVVEEPVVEEAEEVSVMSYAEYVEAELDTEVVVECYVQAHQSWWQDTVTVYAQDEDGAYFLYNMACSEEDSEKLVPGQKIRVTGFKSEWSGEVEIVDATFEFVDGSFVAEPVDLTDVFGTDELINSQNMLFAVKGAVIEAANDEGAAYLYKWDNSGSDGDDLYFNVNINGEVYSFTVESYLCGAGTEVYEAVKALEVGQTVDLVGFLYWYNGANPHITSAVVVG